MRRLAAGARIAPEFGGLIVTTIALSQLAFPAEGAKTTLASRAAASHRLMINAVVEGWGQGRPDSPDGHHQGHLNRDLENAPEEQRKAGVARASVIQAGRMSGVRIPVRRPDQMRRRNTALVAAQRKSLAMP